MKNYISQIGVFSSILLFAACGGSEEISELEELGNQIAKQEVPVEKNPCLLTLDSEGVVVNWTAFKLSEKVGVGGTFDSVTVTGVVPNQTIAEAAKTAQFAIYTTSVNSNNPERDMKIANSFFGTMTNTESISGKIISLNQDGSGSVALTMNGVEKEVDIEWSVSTENRLKLSTAVSVNDWDAKPSLDSLNGVCTAVHTGKDGLSVLWPDVEIEVFADFKSSCE